MATARTSRSPSTRKRDRQHHQGTGAFWFLLGTLVGAFGVGLAWMQQERAPTPSLPIEPSARAPVPTPTFDFYKNLPQEEVLVPVEDPQIRPSPLPPAPKPEPKPEPEPEPEPEPKPATKPEQSPEPTMPPPQATASYYRLQVGSFRNADDAERRKAELALKGIRVDIHQANVGGMERFRLRTERLDKAAAETLSRQLDAQGIGTMPVKAD